MLANHLLLYVKSQLFLQFTEIAFLANIMLLIRAFVKPGSVYPYMIVSNISLFVISQTKQTKQL